MKALYFKQGIVGIPGKREVIVALTVTAVSPGISSSSTVCNVTVIGDFVVIWEYKVAGA